MGKELKTNDLEDETKEKKREKRENCPDFFYRPALMVGTELRLNNTESINHLSSYGCVAAFVNVDQNL